MSRRPTVQWLVLDVVASRQRVHAYEIKQILTREVPHSSVYTALAALQAKGYLTAEWVLPDAGGGPPRKYFQMTASGTEARATHRMSVAQRAVRTTRQRLGDALR